MVLSMGVSKSQTPEHKVPPFSLPLETGLCGHLSAPPPACLLWSQSRCDCESSRGPQICLLSLWASVSSSPAYGQLSICPAGRNLLFLMETQAP